MRKGRPTYAAAARRLPDAVRFAARPEARAGRGHTTLFTVSPVPGTGGGVNAAAVLVAVLTAALTAAPTAAPTAELTAALLVLTGLAGSVVSSVGVSGDGPIGDTFIRCSFTRTSSNGSHRHLTAKPLAFR
jgi:hypothetical protein